MKMPLTKLHAMAQEMEIRPVLTRTAVRVVMESAPIWLINRSIRLLKWSESTPTGKEINSAGTPITKRTTPLMSDLAPSPRTSQTNANRCVLCTNVKRKALPHRYLNGRME